MELSVTRLNLEAYASGQTPHAIVPREPGEVWLVSHDAIRLGSPIQWRKHAQQRFVYIPVVPYLTSPEPDLAMAFMLQLGMRVSFDLGVPVRKLHLVIGHPVHQVVRDNTDFLQVQFGFGLVVD
jgi:hypothetical protein